MDYFLMHKNIAVAEICLDDETCYISKISDIFVPEHIPVGIKDPKGNVDRRALNEWWLSRSIPASRSGLRNALELLNVPSRHYLLAKCFGLSLSDQYWVCPKNSGITWDKVNFFENEFSEDVGSALFGNALKSNVISLVSPDNTSDGWLKKKWIVLNGKRCLMKGGSDPFQQEPFNEALASEIMKRLKINHAEYRLTWENERPYSVCENFISSKTELVSAAYIVQTSKCPNHVSAYEHFLNCCDDLGIPNVRNSLDQMLTLDYIIANTDRHFGNFGAIRNAETLEWLGLSPVYDCGTSMWHDKLMSEKTISADCESKPFKKLHSEQIGLVSETDTDLSSLAGIDEWFEELLKSSPFIDEKRRDLLCGALQFRVETSQRILQEPGFGLEMK